MSLYLTEVPPRRDTLLLSSMFTPLNSGPELQVTAPTRGHDCFLVHSEPSLGAFPKASLGGAMCVVARCNMIWACRGSNSGHQIRSKKMGGGKCTYS